MGIAFPGTRASSHLLGSLKKERKKESKKGIKKKKERQIERKKG